MTLTPVLSVEAGGRVVRGLALPFNQPALVLEDDGSVVAEIMDDQSVDALPHSVPLLVGHNRASPAVGVVRTFGVVPGKGVGVEADLAVNDQDLDTWRRRFAAGLSTGLSIGFRYDKRRTRWERPVRHGDPPVKRPRGVQIEEVSLVQWPAYELAFVTAMAVRGAADELRHRESERVIADWQGERILRGRMAEKRRMGL